MCTNNKKEIPDGYVLLQRHEGKAMYAACLDGGRFHGWLFKKGPEDGQWVSERKLEQWEIMQAEDQRDDNIVHETSGAAAEPQPVARYVGVDCSRYTIEWTNGPLPKGTEFFAAPLATPADAGAVPAPTSWHLAQLRDMLCAVPDGPFYDAKEVDALLARMPTPADAGAGAEQPSLSDDEIDAIWQSMPGGPSHWLKGFGYQNFAKAVEAEVLLNVERARQSPAPVTAEAAQNLRTLAKSGRELRQEGRGYNLLPHDIAELERIASLLESGHSAAQEAAEPVAKFDEKHFHTLVMNVSNAAYRCGKHANDEDGAIDLHHKANEADQAILDYAKSIFAIPAPADRDAIRAEYKPVGKFLYVGMAYEATSSDDPRGITLYRAADAAETRDAKGGV